MSENNPYDKRPQGGGGFSGRGGGGGGGFGKPREPLTPEELKRLRMPVFVVITGNDGIPDNMAMQVDRFAKMVEKTQATIRGGANSETDAVVTKAVRYVEQHAPWANKDEATNKRFYENRNDGSRTEIRGNGSSFNSDECFEFAKRFFFGDFEAVNKFQRANHGKTPRLLFGKNLKSPCQLVLVWSEDGVEEVSKVGTRTNWVGHVIRMASASGIPVINIQNPNAESRLVSFLENLNVQQPAKQSEEPASRPTPTAAGTSGFEPSFGEDNLY